MKTVVLGGVFLLLMSADIQFTPKLKVGWFPEANAIAGVRRRTRRRTAVVVHSADEANAAAQQQAAAAAEPAPAEPAPAATPAPAPAPAAPPLNMGDPLPLGTVTSALPAGCTAVSSGGVEYQKCGSDYYRTAFQGNNLVYVTAQP